MSTATSAARVHGARGWPAVRGVAESACVGATLSAAPWAERSVESVVVASGPDGSSRQPAAGTGMAATADVNGRPIGAVVSTRGDASGSAASGSAARWFPRAVRRRAARIRDSESVRDADRDVTAGYRTTDAGRSGCTAVLEAIAEVAADVTSCTLPTTTVQASSPPPAPMAIARQGRAAAAHGEARMRRILPRRRDGDAAASAPIERRRDSGREASIARHVAYPLADPVAPTAISSHAASRSNSTCR